MTEIGNRGDAEITLKVTETQEQHTKWDFRVLFNAFFTELKTQTFTAPAEFFPFCL